MDIIEKKCIKLLGFLHYRFLGLAYKNLDVLKLSSSTEQDQNDSFERTVTERIRQRERKKEKRNQLFFLLFNDGLALSTVL